MEESPSTSFELDLTTIHKYINFREAIEALKSNADKIRSAHITCRDRVSTKVLDELSLSPLVELSLDLQPCKLPTRKLVQDILCQTKASLKVLKLEVGLMPALQASLLDHTTLESVDLRAKSCTIQQWEKLVVALGTCRRLKEIKLSHAGCLNHQHNLLQKSLEKLVALPSLISLRLTNIATIGVPIFYALESNTTLQTLEVSTFRWGFDCGMKAVARMLSRNSTLRDLTISAMDQGALPIFQALKKDNRSLKRLELCKGSGEWSKETTRALLDVVQNNPVLVEVSIPRREWPNPDIASYLRLHRLQRYLEEQAPLGRGDWLDAIIACKDDTRLVHFCLSRNPALCIS